MRSTSRLIGSLLALAALAHTADAQPIDVPPLRQGLELGGGLQLGRIYCRSETDACNDFTEAGGANLGAAYFFGPRFALMADVWVMTHREDSFTFSHYVNTIGIKVRPLPILTLTAGIGAAHATLDYDGIIDARVTSDDAFAVMGAASLDIVRARRWAIALEARFGNGFYRDDSDSNGDADVIGRNVGVGASFTLFGF